MLDKWSSEFSKSVWKQLFICKNDKRLKINEITITQNMIYELYSSNIDGVEIFESTNEAKNGNDLIVYIQNENNEYNCFVVQAKKSYENNRYEKIAHKVNGKYQLNNLISYANYTRAIPLYFFYSYSDQYKDNEKYKGKYLYNEFGVTVFCAKNLYWQYFNFVDNKFKSIPTVKEIIEDTDSLTFKEFLSERYEREKMIGHIFEPMAFLGNIRNRLFREFSIVEVYENKGWKKIDSDLVGKKMIQGNDNEDDFSPQFKIVIRNCN